MMKRLTPYFRSKERKSTSLASEMKKKSPKEHSTSLKGGMWRNNSGEMLVHDDRIVCKCFIRHYKRVYCPHSVLMVHKWILFDTEANEPRLNISSFSSLLANLVYRVRLSWSIFNILNRNCVGVNGKYAYIIWFYTEVNGFQTFQQVFNSIWLRKNG